MAGTTRHAARAHLINDAFAMYCPPVPVARFRQRLVIPFLTSPSFSLGPVTLHTFGLIIAAAVWVGVSMSIPLYQRAALDTHTGERLNIWIGVLAVLGAHIFSVVFYFPEKLANDPWLLLRLWEDISSFGGMLGGLLGAVLFLWWKNPSLPSAVRWKYLDVVAFVFPFSHAIGRVGCSLAHDHPGNITSFPLAISLRTETARQYITDVYANAGLRDALPPDDALRSLGFHDLGWYELLYLCIVLLPLITLLYRRKRQPGTMVLAFGILYLPVRFALDFLRVVDERYAGLTPGQWVALIAALLLPLLYLNIRARTAHVVPHPPAV